jgi:hypothetical protein
MFGSVRMPCKFDIGVKLHAVELEGLGALEDRIPKLWLVTEYIYLWNTEGTDSVPYADEFDRDIGDSLVFRRQPLDGFGIKSVVDVLSIHLAESLETGLCH